MGSESEEIFGLNYKKIKVIKVWKKVALYFIGKLSNNLKIRHNFLYFPINLPNIR